MSSVKISGLPSSSNLNANPAHSIFPTVDSDTGQTTQITGKAFGSSLYANNTLIVGTGGVLLPNTVTQFTGLSGGYVQVNEQNLSNTGTADYIVTADVGNDVNYYIDVGITNSNYNNTNPFNSLSSSIEPLSGYLYVQGNYANNSQGNLVIGTVNAGTETRFIAGGSANANIIFKTTTSGIKIASNKSLIFGDGSTQITAASPASYVQAAYAQANVTIGVDNTQNTAISATDGKMNSAYTKANNALANSTGIFAGDLTITGSVTSNTGNIGNLTISNNSIYSSLTSVDMTIGQSIATANLVINRTTNITKDLNITANLVTNGTFIDFNNSTFDPNTALVQITASNNFSYVAPSNTNYMLHVTGKANSATRIVLDSFGQNTYPVVVGRMGRGSANAPASAQINDVLMRIVGNGYTGTQFSASSPTKIDFVASENFSDTNRGTQIQFWNTTTGSNTIQKIATFNADTVTFTGVVQPQKGFIYTPTVYPSAQTAITIDMANNSLVRAQTAAGLVVTLSNLLAGKEVVAWITNTAGTNQTFTHGVSATNSTVNATSYNIPGTSTIQARYLSIDGTTQNTFVSIVHA
jgi:hypothetical protein